MRTPQATAGATDRRGEARCDTAAARRVGALACARGSESWTLRGTARCGTRAAGAGGRRGFSLTELLVVVAVIGLLISLVVAGVSVAIESQRKGYTQQILRNTTLAIEQFAQDNPLRLVYDKRDRATFGPYPPYQLFYGNTTWNPSQPVVPQLVERREATSPNRVYNSLRVRFGRDLMGRGPEDAALSNGQSANSLMNIEDDGLAARDNDNRALYTYLAALAPQALASIPSDAIRPLTYPGALHTPTTGEVGEFINTAPPPPVGTPTENTRVPVLGIHDAWGVPLDYMLYVKIEWSAGDGAFRVAERRPVLRSRGVKREIYENWLQNNVRRLNDPADWIWSEPLPGPWAELRPNSTPAVVDTSQNPRARANGWVRAVADGHIGDYNYLPDRD